MDKISTKRLVLFCLSLMAILTLVSISFAYFYSTVIVSNSQKQVTISTSDYIAIKDLSSAIVLKDTTPMNNETAATSVTPYSFSIRNKSTSTSVNYQILLETKADNTLANSFVSASIDNAVTQLSGTPSAATNSGYDKAYVLASGTLAAKEEKAFDLRVWINESGKNNANAQNKVWTSKVVVKAAG